MRTWGQAVACLVLLAVLEGPARGRAEEPAPAVPGETEAVPVVPEAPPPACPEPAKQEATPFRLEDLAWRKGRVSLVPFGVGIVNMNYNTRRLFTGSYSLYAQPGGVLDPVQFEISPQNTFLGVAITGPRVGDAEVSGRIDFDLRGPTPVNNNATPYFFEIFGEMKTDRWRILLGQAHDVISPLDPTVLNFTNGMVGYMPGDIGFFRAQARLDLYFPLGDEAQFTLTGALAQQVVEPLQAAPDLFGSDAGWPDIQSRVGLALGQLEGTARPVEVGVSAHIGERVLEIPLVPQLRHFRTWSLNGDLRAQLTGSTRIQGEVFLGQLLGSYNGAVFQGIDPINLNPIRAAGGWLELEQSLAKSLRGHLGVGIDNTANQGLSAGRRTRNLAYWGNVYWSITPQLTWAVEVSWWETPYVGVSDGKAARVETTVLYHF